jgi:hypothetical protein
MLNKNSLYIQVENTYYVMVLNHTILKNCPYYIYARNIYVLKKYNFFDIYLSDGIYIYLDKYILSVFLDEFVKSRL